MRRDIKAILAVGALSLIAASVPTYYEAMYIVKKDGAEYLVRYKNPIYGEKSEATVYRIYRIGSAGEVVFGTNHSQAVDLALEIEKRTP